MNKYDLFMWLKHEYDDKNKRHQVVEIIYNRIRDKIDDLELELKFSEDDFYKELLNYIVKNTKIVKNFR
tara:strand:+ start:502 stop:708 length:207 start_codon:yes stop_codon:yes gene_type:complete